MDVMDESKDPGDATREDIDADGTLKSIDHLAGLLEQSRAAALQAEDEVALWKRELARQKSEFEKLKTSISLKAIETKNEDPDVEDEGDEKSKMLSIQDNPKGARRKEVERQRRKAGSVKGDKQSKLPVKTARKEAEKDVKLSSIVEVFRLHEKLVASAEDAIAKQDELLAKQKELMGVQRKWDAAMVRADGGLAYSERNSSRTQSVPWFSGSKIWGFGK